MVLAARVVGVRFCQSEIELPKDGSQPSAMLGTGQEDPVTLAKAVDPVEIPRLCHPRLSSMLETMSETDIHFYQPATGHNLPHDPSKANVAPRPVGWISTISAEGVPDGIDRRAVARTASPSPVAAGRIRLADDPLPS